MPVFQVEVKRPDDVFGIETGDQPNANWTVWGPQTGCDPISQTFANDTAWLQQYFDFTPYNAGCGGVGLKLEPCTNTDTSGISAQNRDINHATDVMLGPLIAVACLIGLLTGLHFMSSSNFLCKLRQEELQQRDKRARVECVAYTYIVLYCTLCMTLLVTLIFQNTVYHTIWMCRPYRATYDANGVQTDLCVANISPDRGAFRPFRTHDEWETLTTIARRCHNVQPRAEGSVHDFTIPFAPTDEVLAAINDGLSVFGYRLSLYVVGIGMPFMAFVLWLFFCVHPYTHPVDVDVEVVPAHDPTAGAIAAPTVVVVTARA
jgi:hypothetical protein